MPSSEIETISMRKFVDSDSAIAVSFRNHNSGAYLVGRVCVSIEEGMAFNFRSRVDM